MLERRVSGCSFDFLCLRVKRVRHAWSKQIALLIIIAAECRMRCFWFAAIFFEESKCARSFFFNDDIACSHLHVEAAKNIPVGENIFLLVMWGSYNFDMRERMRQFYTYNYSLVENVSFMANSILFCADWLWKIIPLNEWILSTKIQAHLKAHYYKI